jgi:hypothetical protein
VSRAVAPEWPKKSRAPDEGPARHSASGRDRVDRQRRRELAVRVDLLLASGELRLGLRDRA